MTQGVVMTPNGIVDVCSFFDLDAKGGKGEYTSFECVIGGMAYKETRNKHYSKRYLVALVVRFSRKCGYFR